jgi:hypothetical protein|tara:strand:+ start:129 stop:254 length:126 start_codon:yes stop_codon:yes gene_type:complete
MYEAIEHWKQYKQKQIEQAEMDKLFEELEKKYNEEQENKYY